MTETDTLMRRKYKCVTNKQKGKCKKIDKSGTIISRRYVMRADEFFIRHAHVEKGKRLYKDNLGWVQCDK